MKKLIVGLFLVVAIAGVVYLVQTGVITWQPLTMLIAAVAAPFKFIMSLFGSEEKIRKKYAEEREAELAHRREFENGIKERDGRIQDLLKRVEERDTEIKSLREGSETGSKKKSVKEKQQEGKELFGE